jgi:short-subunit dehydrogenase
MSLARGANVPDPQRWPVLITGGSSGIGLAIAKVFAGRGHAVALVARDPARLDGAAQAVRAAYATPVRSLLLDLASPEAEQRLSTFCNAQPEPFGYLISCAGEFRSGPLAEARTDDVMHLLATNVAGVHGAVRAVLPGMRALGAGRILNVGSLAGFTPTPQFAAYGASKAFVNVATLALREELAPEGISVSLLAPGPVRTDFIVRQSSVALIRWAMQFATDPQVVADCAYRGLMSGERIIVPGLMAKAIRFGMKVMPSSANSRIMGLVQRSAVALDEQVRT